MSFFVDTNVIVGSALEWDRRAACLEILRAIASGEADGHTSTAVLEEVWHLELSGRAGGIGGITRRAHSTFAPLLPVTDAIFRRALELDASRLGANDRIHLATSLTNGIDVMVSADRSFDGIRGVRRVDPWDERARRRLLRSGA